VTDNNQRLSWKTAFKILSVRDGNDMCVCVLLEKLLFLQLFCDRADVTIHIRLL